MSESRLVELTYFDPHASTRLSAYADTVILDKSQTGSVISAIRFGGYPEEVRAMSDAIYGGATIEATLNGQTIHLESIVQGYRRQLSHDGVYAAATLMADDDQQSMEQLEEDGGGEDGSETANSRKCYIFCPAGDWNLLFEEVDRKTAAPLIPEFQDYVLRTLIARGDLRRLRVFSLKERMAAWALARPDDLIEGFGEHHGLLGGMLEAVIKPRWPEDFRRIIDITGQFSWGWRQIHNPDTGHQVADNLTSTEFAVAMLVVRGWTTDEIAGHMKVSASTIKKHQAQIKRKLKIDTWEELEPYMLA